MSDADNDEVYQPRPTTPIKGRGALSNPHNRYETKIVEPFDDGWEIEEELAPAPKTQILNYSTRTIISTNSSPDIPFDYSINPYRGCEHGCVYCYARPTHAFWDLSPGLDFETKIITKPNAAQLLREQFNKPNYKVKPLCIGANTDPYQPLEAELKTTRALIEVLAEFKHPFSIITKSGLITRDLDLLAPLAAENLCSVAVSVTTLSNDLKRKLEPRAPSGRVRLNAIRTLSQAGIRVSMMTAPIIPYINDSELEDILAEGKAAGAASVNYILLRLPLEISGMFREWLAAHFPERAAKVMSVVQQSRGGSDYRSAFGERMRGTGEFAKLINRRFDIAWRKLGYENDARFELDYSLFKRKNEQLALF
jgi:DNA repair photolyase